MRIIEDEVIGELRYLTVEFDQTELVTGGMGIISQDAVKRYFMKECPDLKVKKCGGLKLDSQRNIVTMRIGIVNRADAILVKGKNHPDNRLDKHFDPKDCPNFYDYCRCNEIEDIKRIEAAADGECVTVSAELDKHVFLPPKTEPVALLNPGYDEVQHDLEIYKNQCDELKRSFDKLQHEKDIVGRLYDALVIAVSKDTQKFTDLLVENEKLLAALRSAQTYYENDEYSNMGKVFEQILKEDSADLAEAKKVLEDSYSIPLSEIEMTGADGSKIEGEKSENAGCGDRRKEITVADSGEEDSNE